MAPDDDKDRLKKKLDERGRGDEERFFADRERQALEKFRAKSVATAAGTCPRCGSSLVAARHHGVAVEECPSGHGMWLDQGEVEQIASRERDSWLGRTFYLPKPQR